ncbi:Transcriptional regulator, LysR family [Photobacterium marinum]|uniref:Transcriptional regulator, LysR family n=1 Tax=Photobacterium marinum TaxID=1056511 RepID=L8JBF1_9GAMM|nr:LysR family transcriptional regulator [Photobacterium marinum]ELR64879.1 Transcriptional regulator, LysR family [Photobacterium marinum]
MKWNVNDMPIFLAVVDAGGISAASRGLNVAKSTISRSITRLEEDLSIRLLERNSRQLRLTKEGETFYQHCQLLQEQIELTQASMLGFHHEPQGKLTISMPAGFCLQFIQPKLAEFAERYPHINLELKVSGRAVDLYSSSIDLAIQIGPLPDSDLIATKLIDSPLIWVTSEGYYQDNRDELCDKNLTIELLKKHSKLMLDSKIHSNLHFLYEGKKEAMFTPPHCSCDDSVAIRTAVCSGFGVSLIPLFLVEKDISRGVLKQIGCSFKVTPNSSLYAVYPSKKYLSQKTKVFLDFLKTAIKSD